uniref:Serine--tRNA ligase, mitochondrial n=1 Tax=Lygus hesperus TaxID=30085 RepID=A0A0A9WLB4_LYGHE
MLSKTFSRSLKSYTVLKPFIDFEARLCKISELKSNIRRRKLNVNVDEIVGFHSNLKKLEDVKISLEESREQIRIRLSRMEHLMSDDSEEKRKLKISAKMTREDYKQIKSSALDLEQNLIGLMMGLPDDLHPKTGDVDEVIHETKVASGGTESHLDIGKRLDVLDFRSHWGYFLLGKAAALELESVANLSKQLKNDGFVGFSNPDFSKEIVVDGSEGVNSSVLPLTKFEDDQDTTFITGGASLLPFLSYFTKSVVQVEDLPLKCYSTGRQYSYKQQPRFGLYDAPQTNACQIFVLSSPSDQDGQLPNLMSMLTHFYESFGVHFRVVVKSASSLCVAESLRVSFELFSPHFNQFFECGHISMYGTNLSKNLNIHCGGGNTNNFLSIMSGTVFRVAPLLACALETKHSL